MQAGDWKVTRWVTAGVNPALEPRWVLIDE